MTVQEYIDKVNSRYKTGITTELSFRGDLQNLLEHIITDAQVTNEPTRIECGAPDYIITKKEIPIGYIEAKDLGANLNSKSYNEQFKRYRAALPNLIITNYLDFKVYKDGELVTTYSIGAIEDGRIIAQPDQYQNFTNLIKDFSTYVGQTIKSSQKLATMMAGKAKMLAAVIGEALESDEETDANSTLQEQLGAFKEILIHDITPKGFADIYAQTIAYGMFAARLHDYELHTFSRIEAAQKIPKTNPFLRKLFGYIAGIDLDDRLVWIVDALADIFRATDVRALLKNFGKATRQQDPIIHFYETFLSEYDPKLRKSRGVWYTPEPVVNFIVRAADDILKDEFGLKNGLASTETTEVEVATQGTDLRKKDNVKTVKQTVHKVQILDPATGTGTFLAEVIRQIHDKFKGQQGIWSQYVENHLIPRINGFELLMASYAMAHLKLDMLLTETDYKPKKDQRLRVYLTNSLEEHHKDTGTLFANWLSTEANEASRIKRDTPVMVVLGNPPYSVSSTNKGEWIEGLVADYKKDLNERNIQPLSDDYIKFIRYGQHYIEKNGEGILAFITNNSFLDGLIHRQMRKELLNTFDKIYVLDLHGSTKKNEKTPTGEKDENVFDIQQGVSVNIFIKKSSKNINRSETYRFDVLGKRSVKYDFLANNTLRTVNWNKIDIREPDYFFFNRDYQLELTYNDGILIKSLFCINSSGITTERDHLTIQFEESILHEINSDIQTLSEDDFRKKHTPKADGRDWKVLFAKKDLLKGQITYTDILYRPFDKRKTIYSGNSKGFMAYPRKEVMQHIIKGENIALLSCRQQTSFDFQHIFISNTIAERCTVSLQTGEVGYVFPLYLYPDGGLYEKGSRQPNLDEKIVVEIAKGLGLTFTNEKEDTPDTFAPIDLLDYIYAVLHSPTYRETYKEFLKIDFPRVPYPKDKKQFWQLVALGGELRQIHLLESDEVTNYITQYPVDGDNVVGKMGKHSYKDGKVYINEAQYFDGVPEVAWEFYIGGYQPAQKWLKDRKDRTLSIDDIMHYQKIIVALTETDRIMKEIDAIKIIEQNV